MALATQYYKPNEEFQISSVAELAKYSSEYIWNGRTLTSWTDESGTSVELDAKLTKNTFTAALSGNWKLNQLSVTFNIISNETDPECIGGYLSVHFDTLDNFKPLPSRTSGDFTLQNGETNNDRYYESALSIYAIANDGWIFNRMRIYRSLQSFGWSNWIADGMLTVPGNDYASLGNISVEAEFVKGILTYYSGVQR